MSVADSLASLCRSLSMTQFVLATPEFDLRFHLFAPLPIPIIQLVLLLIGPFVVGLLRISHGVSGRRTVGEVAWTVCGISVAVFMAFWGLLGEEYSLLFWFLGIVSLVAASPFSVLSMGRAGTLVVKSWRDRELTESQMLDLTGRAICSLPAIYFLASSVISTYFE